MNTFLQILAATISTKDTNIPKIEAKDIVPGVLGTVYWAAGIAAVVVIIIGGILYATSDGDASKITRAKNAILYAVVGLLFVMMAFLITNYVVGWF